MQFESCAAWASAGVARAWWVQIDSTPRMRRLAADDARKPSAVGGHPAEDERLQQA